MPDPFSQGSSRLAAGLDYAIPLGLTTRLTSTLSTAEAELNDRVYRLFDLTADEVKLLQKEVEH